MEPTTENLITIVRALIPPKIIILKKPKQPLLEMNQKKNKSTNIRIMREECYFFQKNKDTKNNLYIKNIQYKKDTREIYEYFL